MNANLEEAANIATEYLSRLTSAVIHLIEEIRKETQKYFRHSNKNPGQQLSGKDAAIPETVNALYAAVDALAAEKTALAERLVKIFERAMARLQHDLQRILKLQGDEPGLPPTQHFLNSVDSTVQQIHTGLRTATAAVEPAPVSAPVAPPPKKKQRVAATQSAGSIKLPSPVPVSGSAYSSSNAGGVQKSGLSRQVHPRQSPVRSRRAHASSGMDDEDAEGEEDEEGGDADDELYCYCQKLSYGEMIACDNESCRFQWFHISCLNLPANQSLPDTWFCDECSALLGKTNTMTQTTTGGPSGGRKGRKKQ
ncbi:hypothetical protein C8Q74DRAFT_1218285 [Fomes fomentarius]|nr:hypothetical protein C8Q74DRAFT_1218285 [Fomes fomentarius]